MLNPFQQSELRFLRQQVDKLQDQKYSTQASKSIDQDLFVARKELQTFVSKLRKEGVKI
tara:strand:+ start:563 stop:739 length:177 start_codon:yes stop_codon:yes gene_type:complete